MKKSISKLIQNLVEDSHGKMHGGFHTIMGGASIANILNPFCSNASTPGCSNSQYCGGTNSDSCSNSGACDGQNILHCTNSGVCS